MKENFKKWAAIVPLALMFALPGAEAGKMVSVSRDEVNMRAGAGTNHEPLWKLGQGYPLLVIESRGRWYKVRDFENDEGWIYRSLTSSRAHHVVKATAANIRKAPSTRSAILGKAYYGEVLRTLERRKDWVKVRHESGVSGWISKRLLWGW